MAIPATTIKLLRDWAWNVFPFGEWNRTSEITAFLREQLGYRHSTPQQYARLFLDYGVANRDFEVRLNGQEWRWAPPQEQPQ